MYKRFKLSKFNILRLLTYLLFVVLIIISFNYYINTSYSKIMNTFYSEFNNSQFTEAKDTLEGNTLVNIFKKNKKNSDLNEYFTSIINVICTKIKSNSISKNQGLIFLKEINSYKILNSSLDKLILNLDENYIPETNHACNSFLQLASVDLNDNNIAHAIMLLNKIPTSNKNYYSKAQDLMERCKNKYRENLILEADNLCSQEYFSKAIDLLENYDTSILSANDQNIANKISEIDSKRTEYLASLTYENDTDASNLITTNINYSNINNLNISSDTSYLVHVDLNKQLVSIYSGYINNWNLINEFSCSTGISGEDTPEGIFTITNRGEWFFSQDYQQGGKYWVQFLGDYLFHSLPYDESQSQILDYTLGTPASHGCIRLETVDAKWIYDNVDNNTKVIIN